MTFDQFTKKKLIWKKIPIIFTFILSNYKIHFVGNHFLKSLIYRKTALSFATPSLHFCNTQLRSGWVHKIIYTYIYISMYVQSDRKKLIYQKISVYSLFNWIFKTCIKGSNDANKYQFLSIRLYIIEIYFTGYNYWKREMFFLYP